MQESLPMSLPGNIKGLSPVMGRSSTNILLASISTALHLDKAPVTGQVRYLIYLLFSYSTRIRNHGIRDKSGKILFPVFTFVYIFFFFGGGFRFQHCFICRPSDSTVPTDAGICLHDYSIFIPYFL
jgi:hypothetical protein